MHTMETEQFFLKWHNFENNLSSGFADLLQKESMVDVTLAAEGKIVQAHKIILSICSSYFKSMFQVNPCQHPIVVLKDVGYQELTDMLDFMYKGEANVRQQDLPSFLKLAETLKVKGLAGGQVDPDENLKRRSSQCLTSNLSHSTKDSLANEKEESSNDLIENVILRKKRKRSSSPFKILDPKNIPHSQNIKVEEKEECDNNSMKNKDMNAGQNVIMKEERLSDNSLDSYGENHLADEVLEDGKDAGPSALEENCEATPQASVLKSDEYSFIETSFGGYLLVFKGYSFRRKSITNERSYWFCCRAKCTSKGILHSDGKFQLTKTEHNHKPDVKLIKKKEKLLELKKLALNLNIPGPDLLKFAGIEENVKKHLGLIRTWRSRNNKQNQSNIDFTPTFTVTAGLNYQRLSTRISPKEMILHSGYLYSQDSANYGKGDHKYWRCRMKECKARAKTDEIGNFTILKPNHDHAPLRIEKVSREFTLKGKNETPSLYEAATEISKTASRESRRVKKKILTASSTTERNKSQKLSTDEKQELVSSKMRLHSHISPSETFSIDDLVSETLEKNYGVTSQLRGSLN